MADEAAVNANVPADQAADVKRLVIRRVDLDADIRVGRIHQVRALACRQQNVAVGAVITPLLLTFGATRKILPPLAALIVPWLTMLPAFAVAVKLLRPAAKSALERFRVDATSPPTSICAPWPNVMPLGLMRTPAVRAQAAEDVRWVAAHHAVEHRALCVLLHKARDFILADRERAPVDDRARCIRDGQRVAGIRKTGRAGNTVAPVGLAWTALAKHEAPQRREACAASTGQRAWIIVSANPRGTWSYKNLRQLACATRDDTVGYSSIIVGKTCRGCVNTHQIQIVARDFDGERDIPHIRSGIITIR